MLLIVFFISHFHRECTQIQGKVKLFRSNRLLFPFEYFHFLEILIALLSTCNRSNAEDYQMRSSYIKANAFAVHLIMTTNHFSVSASPSSSSLFHTTHLICTESKKKERTILSNKYDNFLFHFFLCGLFQQIDIP